MISIVSLLRLMTFLAGTAACAVSGFAQTDTGEQPVTRASLNVAREYLPIAVDMRADVGIPSNLIVAPVYSQIVDAMLLRSPTFRRQCLRIQNVSNLTVVVDRNSPPMLRHARAWTTIERAGHRLHAAVRIIAEGREAELIAHELEHVIEYLDHIDLPSKARLESSGVSECDCGHRAYETSRAVHVGQKVAREVRDSR